MTPLRLGISGLHLWRPKICVRHCDSGHYYSGFTKETPELKFPLRFFFVQPQFAILKLIRMREDFTDEHMAWCSGGQRRVYAVEDQHKYCV